MAYTLQQYNALTAAIANGAVKVKYADKEVDYMTLDNMLRIKGLMESELGIGQTVTRKKVVRFQKGLR